MKKNGFTLIELVMVIVILAILGSVALPKFANLKRDANIAALKAVQGSAASAMALAHAKSVIEGTETLRDSTITISFAGQLVPIGLRYGYPSENGLHLFAGAHEYITRQSDVTNFGNASYFLYKGISDCRFHYKDATATSAAVLSRNDPDDLVGC